MAFTKEHEKLKLFNCHILMPLNTKVMLAFLSVLQFQIQYLTYYSVILYLKVALNHIHNIYQEEHKTVISI